MRDLRAGKLIVEAGSIVQTCLPGLGRPAGDAAQHLDAACCRPALGRLATIAGRGQLLASCKVGGGKLFHILSGNLSHQIEHHLFPDMCGNRYPEIAPRVRALADRYGLRCNTGSLTRQYGPTWTIWRLAFPGGA